MGIIIKLKNKYAFRIGHEYNDEMQCHEMIVQVGNIQDEQKLIDLANKIKELIEREGRK